MPEESAKEIHDRPEDLGGDAEWTDTAHSASAFGGDVEALEADLRSRVYGEVRFDGGSKATYSTDSSNYRAVPIGVVIPKDVDALVNAVKVCHKHGAPVTHRGCGTSLAGQCCNHAVIIDGSKYLDHVIEVNPEEQYAWVQPGVRRDQLARQTEEKYNLTFAPDTSTHEYATFGGMIGNNACGMHSQMARRTQDNVEEMEILLYDGTRMHVGPTSEEELEDIIARGGRKGEVYERLRDLRDEHADEIRARYPDIPRRVSGYNLTELLPERGFNVARALVGTEGTCVTILRAKVKLVHSPPARSLLVMGFEDVYTAGDHVHKVGEMGPTALEGLDYKLIEYMQKKDLHTQYLPLLPEGQGYLIAEFGGDSLAEAHDKAREAQEAVESAGWEGFVDARLIDDLEEQSGIWKVRESGLAATAHLPNEETWPGWEDSAIPPESLGDYLRELRDLYDKYGFDASVYGHFGQGCVHTRIPFSLRTEHGLEQYRQFVDEASDLCMRYDGSFSAEHGDGQARGELLPKMFGKQLIDAFRDFKRIWDPDWRMNPGKVVEPRRMTEGLRLGTDYHPGTYDTYFSYPEDDGSFSHATVRCVGVGKCRRHEVGSDDVMCPSFIATHEEKHSTRGRSRLLFEMLNGDETPNAWDNDDVHDALDLCLACKGCKNDCPVNVDMATYKSEFLSHYYEHNRRPRSAFAMGLIHWWARLASLFPKVANFFTQTAGFAEVFKAVGGVAQERDMPPFAEQTFREWFDQRPPRHLDKPKVALFPDTFNNFFKPDTAKAAVAVLEDAGYQVEVPQQTLCCGRPLYDFGWIDRAEKLWQEMLGALRPYYRSDIPIVGLEPSCVASFRDELPNLFPNDDDAQRLTNNVVMLSEFLDQHAEDYEPPKLDRKAVVHGHCHHKSIMGGDSEKKLLKQMGLDFDDFVPASCCGMAGAFGFEEEHYDVSIKAGEYSLLPTVRGAGKDAIVITDGFSCREQIEQTTDRRALHMAEVMHLAMSMNGRGKDYPEHPYLDEMRSPDGESSSMTTMGLLAVGGFAASALYAYFSGE